MRLDEGRSKTLFNLNGNRVVKIVTYDDLLERLNRLIAAVDQVSCDEWQSSLGRADPE